MSGDSPFSGHDMTGASIRVELVRVPHNHPVSIGGRAAAWVEFVAQSEILIGGNALPVHQLSVLIADRVDEREAGPYNLTR